MAYYSIQKIVLDKFLQNVFTLSAIMNDMHAKNQDRSPRNYFHFRCVACATFDRNLIHSADACLLIMVRV